MKPITALIWLVGNLLLAAGESGQRMDELSQLSIEELISIKVVSADKESRSLSENAAAVFVVTREDILRSGATTLPDALRLVPGAQVAKIGLNIHAVSIRGFNELHADKLLVLIDGRSIYNHMFSGVFWPDIEVAVEHIERIEVVRGPGSTLWGANAVNGIINIITSHASDTQGGYVSLTGGTIEKGAVSARYGFKLSPQTFARVTYSYREREQDDVRLAPNLATTDQISDGRIDVRIDHRFANRSTLYVSGESAVNITRRSASRRPLNIDDRARHFMMRWTGDENAEVRRSVQAYWESFERIGEFRYTVWDLEFQEQRQVGRHQLVWGLGYRAIDDDLERGLAGGFEFEPQRNREQISNLFISDRITLIPQRLHLNIGTKVEKNEHTDVETQPNARLRWTLSKQREAHAWFSVSRAVHIPSRLERNGLLLNPLGPPQPRIIGNPDLDAPTVLALESGFRSRVGKTWWLDVALFHNDYRDLVAFEETQQRGIFQRVNGMEGTTHGVELTFEYRPSDWWRLTGSLTHLDADLETLPAERHRLPLHDHTENQSPENQATLRSQMSFGQTWQFDLTWRYMDEVSQTALANPAFPPPNTIDSYDNLDAHLSVLLRRSLQLHLVGRDLLGEHREISLYEHEPHFFVELRTWF